MAVGGAKIERRGLVVAGGEVASEGRSPWRPTRAPRNNATAGQPWPARHATFMPSSLGPAGDGSFVQGSLRLREIEERPIWTLIFTVLCVASA